MQIQSVSPTAFQSLKTRLQSTHQAEITGEAKGTITGHGVTATYQYDATEQVLTVDVTHHPFFIPVATIENQLRAAIIS